MAEEKKATAATEEVRYIGVSAQEFIKYAHEERQTGAFADKTRIDPKVHASYNQFVDALQSPTLKIQYYVFVFSRFIIIKIAF
jgi:hypothetical protein